MVKAKVTGALTVTNAADDGERHDPCANIPLPIRLLAKNEMALHEELVSGSYGDTKFSLSRTFDGSLWVRVGDDCYVLALEDIITQVLIVAGVMEKDHQ